MVSLRAAACCLVPFVVGPLLSQQASAPSILVHVDQPTHTISPQLYGIFFEEINHAGEGGLCPQLLRNPTFEEPGNEKDPLPGWTVTAIDPAWEGWPRSKVALSASVAAPANPQSPRHAKIELEGKAALRNRGHFGLPIRDGEEYVLELTLREEPHVPAGERPLLPMPIQATVQDPQGRCVWTSAAGGRSDFGLRPPEGLDATWRTVTHRAVATGTTADGELRISFAGSATFFVDTVTLRPARTWKDHGLRQDLAALLDGLHPAFVRFPGGCYVEGGDKLADAFRWQRTLGPLADRPGHQNANWGYWTTTGLGFHEYLQLCEDLGAAAMYVTNCGLSHKEVVPMAELQPWIDETLAAIEYAIADPSTPWGARRAAAGHPAPFPLRYVEIGNENGMFGDFGGSHAAYTERYEAFRRAIAAKFPAIETIANVRVKAPMQIVDDHFYMSSGWFWENADRYAHPAAGDPAIYIGEYAVTWNPGKTGNLRGALGEAAFLLGLQRSGPHVKMASYAPLFVHVQDRKWNPDLIQFDGLRACGTPSYHVQSVLAQSRPAQNLECTGPRLGAAAGRGSIGLGTWNTEAEFRDVELEVDGKVVYRSDFAAGTAGWRTEAGQWAVVDGAFRQNEGGDMRWCWLDRPELRGVGDCVVRCKARKLSGAEGFLVMFHTQGALDWTWWNVGGWGNHEHALERTTSGSKGGLGARARGSVETGKWYDVRIECRGGRVKTFLDGVAVHDVEDRGAPDFAVAAGVAADGAIVVEAVNGSDEARPMPVQLVGGDDGARVIDVIEVTGPGLDAENTLDAPDVVGVRRSSREAAGYVFEHTFAPRSLTVLRVRMKP